MAGTDTAAVQGMTIACPAGWRDASMLVVTADRPGGSGVTPTLVVTREWIADDLPTDRVERLRAFVERQLDAMRETLPGFAELASHPVSVDRSTAELRIGWTSDGTRVTQSIVYALADDRTVVISTATAGEPDFAEFEPVFRSMLQSFRTT